MRILLSTGEYFSVVLPSCVGAVATPEMFRFGGRLHFFLLFFFFGLVLLAREREGGSESGPQALYKHLGGGPFPSTKTHAYYCDTYRVLCRTLLSSNASPPPRAYSFPCPNPFSTLLPVGPSCLPCLARALSVLKIFIIPPSPLPPPLSPSGSSWPEILTPSSILRIHIYSSLFFLTLPPWNLPSLVSFSLSYPHSGMSRMYFRLTCHGRDHELSP